MAYSSQQLLLLVVSLCLMTPSKSQNLPTTCPKVQAARCPGTITNLKKSTAETVFRSTSASSQTCSSSDSSNGGRPPVPAAGECSSSADDQQQRHRSLLSQQQAAVVAAGGVPQRVVPLNSADTPVESPEQQQRIIKHLQALLLADMASSSPEAAASDRADAINNTKGNAGDGVLTGQKQQQQQQEASASSAESTISHGNTELPVAAAAAAAAAAAGTGAVTEVPLGRPPQLSRPAAAAAVDKPILMRASEPPVAAAVDKPYTGPVSQVTRTLTYLENTKVKVGLDLQRGGTISWLSSPLIPSPWTNKNLINVWDQGRLLQQSFYGCVDGSCWADTPWLWNPVQGGSWDNSAGQTVKQVVKPKVNIYVQSYPRNWGKADLIKQVLLSSNVTLSDDVVVSQFTMSYTGNITHPYMTQEIPAVFVPRKLSVLAYYASSKPWTKDANVTFSFPPAKNIYARPTENWAAFIDPVSGWGVGVFNPMAWMGITAYRVGEDDSDQPWDCSYFAHTIRMQLHKGMKPYNYTVYITVGKLSSIRSAFYKLKATPGVMPVTTKAEAPAPLNPAFFLAEGQPDLGRNSLYGRPLNYSQFSNVDITAAAAAAVAAAAAGSNGTSSGNAAGGKADLTSSGAAGAVDNAAAAAEGRGAMSSRSSSSSNVPAGRLAGVLVAAVTVGGAMLAAALGLAVNRKQKSGAAAVAAAAAAASAAAAGPPGPSSSSDTFTLAEGPEAPPPEPLGDSVLNTPKAATATAASSEAAAAAVMSTPTAAAAAAAAAASPGVLTRSAAALLRARARASEDQ